MENSITQDSAVHHRYLCLRPQILRIAVYFYRARWLFAVGTSLYIAGCLTAFLASTHYLLFVILTVVVMIKISSALLSDCLGTIANRDWQACWIMFLIIVLLIKGACVAIIKTSYGFMCIWLRNLRLDTNKIGIRAIGFGKRVTLFTDDKHFINLMNIY